MENFTSGFWQIFKVFTQNTGIFVFFQISLDFVPFDLGGLAIFP
jgi:hypothetical protein